MLRCNTGGERPSDPCWSFRILHVVCVSVDGIQSLNTGLELVTVQALGQSNTVWLSQSGLVLWSISTLQDYFMIISTCNPGFLTLYKAYKRSAEWWLTISPVWANRWYQNRERIYHLLFFIIHVIHRLCFTGPAGSWGHSLIEVKKRNLLHRFQCHMMAVCWVPPTARINLI